MPPLPSTLSSEALQLISSFRRREIDIIEVQIPRLRTCPGPLSLQQNLATELREDLDALARQIESLDVMVDDQKAQKSRKELRALIEELKETLLKLRKDYRAAMLTSKRAIDTSSMSNKAELFASPAGKGRDAKDVNEKVTEDAVQKANNDVTEALQRTLGLMQGELERSVLATQMLDSSIATLRATSSTHDMLSNAMDTSKQLITALQKADWIDRLIIFFGLGVFFLVAIFILKQRVVDRSVRLAFWWTRFLPSGKPPAVPISSLSTVGSFLFETATIAPSVMTTAAAAAASVTASVASSPLSLNSETISLNSNLDSDSASSSSSVVSVSAGDLDDFLGSIASEVVSETELLVEPSRSIDEPEILMASETTAADSVASAIHEEL